MTASALDMKTPPHDLAVEGAVLGSMIIEREAASAAAVALRPADFFSNHNAFIFDLIIEMERKDVPIDFLTVTEELRGRGKLIEIGGAEYLAKLIEAVATTAHVDYYCELVKKYSVKRELIRAAAEIALECYNGDSEAKDVLELAEKRVYSASEGTYSTELRRAGEQIGEAIDSIQAVWNRKTEITGLSTGHRRLDRLTSGLQPGNMIVIAARPGMGKTSLALDFARHASLANGIPTVFFSFEMTTKELNTRLLSTMGAVPLHQLRNGIFSRDKWKDVTDAAEKIHDAPLYIESSSKVTSAAAIRSSSRRLATRMARAGTPLGLIVVDYLQLLSSPGARGEGRQAEVAEISRSLKALGLDLGVPIVALSQLNRDVEERGGDGRPKLSNLRESGAIEQDADLVMFIWRPAFYKADATKEDRAVTKLLIAKHRNGPPGEIDMFFNDELTKFVETEKEDRL